MFEKLNAELIGWVLLLLVPGFLLRYNLSFFLSPKEDVESRNWLTVVAFSGVNFLPLFFWLAYLRKVPYVSGCGEFIAILALVFLWPFVMAYILAKGVENDWLRRLGKWLGLNPKRIHPTGWDFRFINGESSYVLVKLKDGGYVAGLFQDESVAGSSPQERDLFLEKVFLVDENGKWTEKDRTLGILIKADQIAQIEFMA